MVNRNPISRAFWTLLGSISLGVGLIGILVPLLPTTPFLLASAFCFLRGSERMHRWLLSNPIVGKYLADYLEARVMQRRSKIITISFLWVTLFIALKVMNSTLLLATMVFIVGAAISVHIALLPSEKKTK